MDPLADFFLKWQPKVIGFLQKKGAKTDKAMVLADESMVRFLEQDYAPSGPILLKIAYNLLVDDWRKQHGEREKVKKLAFESRKECQTPLDETQRLERATILEKALQRLSIKQRIVVKMHAINEIGLAQIGKVLGITREAAKGLYGRGLSKLRNDPGIRGILKEQELHSRRYQGRSSP